MRKAKTCECGHNKKAHSYYYGCSRCGCGKFHPANHAYTKAMNQAIARMDARRKVGEE